MHDTATEVARAPAELAELYYQMALIRRFEERLLELFETKQLTGTTHTYLGQEATAVSALRWLEPGDMVFSQHRSHGYFIAAGGDPRALFLEILGDSNGVCRGIGGSQHLMSANFLSNGILGGTAGIATGVALAQKLRAGRHVVVSFLGDGTLGEGLVYESFNMASLWGLPIIYVVENNQYAQTTPIELQVAGSIIQRAQAFGIVADEVESNDVVVLSRCFEKAFDHVRGGKGPYCQIVHTYRLGPHSKGDDFRPESERRLWSQRDPLRIAQNRIGSDAAPTILARANSDAEAATAMPSSVSSLSLAELGTDADLIPREFAAQDGCRRTNAGQWMVRHLQQVFAELLDSVPELYLIGEDILDPYGGAFKVYRGLSSRFPDRVIATPISEAGIIALANGLALKGLRPVVEVMFGDFATLAVDQILNHATKFCRLHGDCSGGSQIVLRLPSGGYRGYGPTHSQSLEKLFLGIPGLIVTACDVVHDPLLIWRRMLGLSVPCVHVENKLLYSTVLPEIVGQRLGKFHLASSVGYFPTTTLSLDPGNVDVAIVAYGGMINMAMEAAERLFVEHEVLAAIVVPSQLAPLPVEDLSAAIRLAGSVIVLEEGNERAGFGAEVIAALAARGDLSGKAARRCAAADTLIPSAASLEREVLPSVERLVATALGSLQ